MAEKKRKTQSSASLTKRAHNLLQQYRNYGVKNVLSVGLELFEALPPEERERRTWQAMDEDKRDRLAAAAAKEGVTDEERAVEEEGGAPRGRPKTRRRRS